MTNRYKLRWMVLPLSTTLVPGWLAGCGSSDDRPGTVTGDVAPSMPANPGNPAASGSGAQGMDGAGMATMEPGGSGAVGNEDAPVAEETPGDVTLDTPAEAPEGEGSGGGAEEISPPCSATTTLQAGNTTQTIDVGGVERSFILHVPPSYDGSTRVPLVFDFHGLGGNANNQLNRTGWDDIADEEGFIAVYPQGLPRAQDGNPAWNGGGCCTNGVGDDVGFVRAMISRLQNEACIDARRVFASGCSNGGAMSFRLACEAADVIAAVAPVDFDCVVGGGCGNCSPSRPITEVQFRGTNDTAVPYGGANSGAQANFANWGEINACMGDAAPLQQSGDGCEAFPSCGAGAETVLCTVQDGTHCGSYGSFDIARVAWDILKNHPIP
jgi:polyhydroxybutyrate depolymerase